MLYSGECLRVGYENKHFGRISGLRRCTGPACTNAHTRASRNCCAIEQLRPHMKQTCDRTTITCWLGVLRGAACTHRRLMPSLDRGDPAGTLQTLFQDTWLAARSDRSATSISVQPTHSKKAPSSNKGQRFSFTNVRAVCYCWAGCFARLP
jgi:hypothetical protein